MKDHAMSLVKHMDGQNATRPSTPLVVRRIVTSHDQGKKAVAVSNESLTAVSRHLGEGISESKICSTAQMPIDNSAASDAEQRAGYEMRYNSGGNGQGTTFRIDAFEPGNARFAHRTETLDYTVMVSGEIDVEFDSGEIAHVKAGEVIVQRGTMHTWVRRL